MTFIVTNASYTCILSADTKKPQQTGRTVSAGIHKQSQSFCSEGYSVVKPGFHIDE